MRVEEIMTRLVTTVSPTLSLADAQTLMHQKRIRHLVVADKQKVIGVLSDRDIPRRGSAAADRTVADVMTTAVATSEPRDTVRQIANLMRGRTIGCLPVLDGRKLVGIVTSSDLLTLLGRGVDRPGAAARHELNHRVPHRKSHGAYGSW